MSSSQQAFQSQAFQSQAFQSQAFQSQAFQSQALKIPVLSCSSDLLVKEVDDQKETVVETESKVIDLSQTDSVVSSVVQSFLQRAEFGLKKYGKTMDRDDLTVLQWIQHAQEEHMDAILYLEKLKQLEMKRAVNDKDGE
jgi:hypothetical protein